MWIEKLFSVCWIGLVENVYIKLYNYAIQNVGVSKIKKMYYFYSTMTH